MCFKTIRASTYEFTVIKNNLCQILKNNLVKNALSELISSNFGGGIMYVYVAVWSFVMTHCYKRLPLLEKLSKAESKSNPLDLVQSLLRLNSTENCSLNFGILSQELLFYFKMTSLTTFHRNSNYQLKSFMINYHFTYEFTNNLTFLKVRFLMMFHPFQDY